MSANVFDLQASLGLDSSKFKQSIKEAIDEAKKLQKELEKTGKEANDLGTEVDKEGKEAKDGAEENKRLGTEVKNAGEHADKAKGKFAALGGAIKDGLEAAAKVGMAAVGTAATGISVITKQAMSEAAEYEQLAGGIKKIYGDMSDTVLENAKNSLASSATSINEYLSGVTGFSQTLLNSLSRGEQKNIDELKAALDEEYIATKETLADEYDDVKKYWNDRIKASKAAKDGEADMLTAQRDEELKALKRSQDEQLRQLKAHNKEVVAETERSNKAAGVVTEEMYGQAAEYADMIMRNIADNANTFGKFTAEELQNVYNALARNNFMLLDNLNLGYAGSKEGMEQLIADANDYAESIGEAGGMTVDSFADMARAIDLIQRKIGISNTAADEAAKTMSGSMGAVRNAWKNMLIEITKSDGDIEGAFQVLSDNAGAMLENMLPKIQNTLGGIGTVIENAAPQVIQGLKNLLPKVIPPLIKSAGSLVSALGQGLLQATPELLDMGKNALKTLSESFTAADIDIDNSVFAKLLGAIADNAPEYISYAETILANLGNALINADHAKFAEKIGNVIVSGINSVTDLLADLDMNKVGKNIADFVNAFPWKDIAESVINLLGSALGSLGDIAAGFFENMDGATLFTAIGVLGAPKLLGGLTQYIGGSEGQALGKAAGSSWSSAFMLGIEAFGLGWTIGTYLRDNVKIGDKTLGEWVDQKVEETFSGKDEEGNYTNALFGAAAAIKDYNEQQQELYDTYTDRYGNKYWITSESGETSEAMMRKIERDKNASKETFKYYYNGKLNSAFKYDDKGNLSEAWKKYGGLAFGDGGRVTQPTIALIGEKEPETIIPDSKLNQMGNITIENININGTFDMANPEDRRRLIEEFSMELKTLSITQQRAVGGKSWQ